MMIGKPLLFALVVALNIAPGAHAAPPPAAQIEINHLLGLIQQSGCEFYRNGTWYDAQQARAHLRTKYDMLAADGQIKTAEDFIEKAASTSSMSGQPYHKVRRRCGDDNQPMVPRGADALAQPYQPKCSLRTAHCAPYARTLCI
jgi:hypothetical protein